MEIFIKEINLLTKENAEPQILRSANTCFIKYLYLSRLTLFKYPKHHAILYFRHTIILYR